MRFCEVRQRVDHLGSRQFLFLPRQQTDTNGKNSSDYFRSWGYRCEPNQPAAKQNKTGNPRNPPIELRVGLVNKLLWEDAAIGKQARMFCAPDLKYLPDGFRNCKAKSPVRIRSSRQRIARYRYRWLRRLVGDSDAKKNRVLRDDRAFLPDVLMSIRDQIVSGARGAVAYAALRAKEYVGTSRVIRDIGQMRGWYTSPPDDKGQRLADSKDALFGRISTQFGPYPSFVSTNPFTNIKPGTSSISINRSDKRA